MGLFCNHDWQQRTGLDSGSMCSKCGSTSSKEVDLMKSSGLNDGVLQEEAKTMKAKLLEKIFPTDKSKKNNWR